MSAPQDKPAARGRIATVVATAAVTLAIGVTTAALGGYLAPATRAGETTTGPVVLVPVAPDPATLPTPPAAPEVVFAASEAAEDRDDHRHRRGDREREHEDDHDGDDD